MGQLFRLPVLGLFVLAWARYVHAFVGFGRQQNCRAFGLVDPHCQPQFVPFTRFSTSDVIFIVADDDDDDEGDKEESEEESDDEVLEADPYEALAASEFDSATSPGSSITTAADAKNLTTTIDWGGALGQLRQRVEDVEQGKSGDPSQALFRLMSAQSPNQLIGTFLQSAQPQVVQAMSGAINSLLGGLSNPQMGVEMVVQSTGDKIGSLCFQLQMTGYVRMVLEEECSRIVLSCIPASSHTQMTAVQLHVSECRVCHGVEGPHEIKRCGYNTRLSRRL